MGTTTRQAPSYYGEGLAYLPSEPWAGTLVVLEGTDGTGRSTQLDSLSDWLEVQGFPVMETGWLRGKLLGRAVSDAKKGHTLTRLTYTLMYATDFADRLEHEIVPALQGGKVVLADRYIFTSIARAVARGVSPQWVRELYGFAPKPDLVFYLQISAADLAPRVLRAGRMNYWESGMDLNLGADLFDSFHAYQGMLIDQFEQLAEEYGFLRLKATATPEQIQLELRRQVGAYLSARHGRPLATDAAAGCALPHAHDPLEAADGLPVPSASRPLLRGSARRAKR